MNYQDYRRSLGESEEQETNNPTIFMAYDGDNAGRLVGRAVLANDVDALQEASSRITHGHDIVKQWVEDRGGEIISSGGDEGTFSLPSSAIEDIEQLRADYAHFTGLTITVGVGKTLSEAGKALMAGKLRGKDQIVQYDDSVEQTLAEEQVDLSNGSASEEGQKLGEAYLKQEPQQGNEGETDEPTTDSHPKDLCAETDGDANNSGINDICAETDGSGKSTGSDICAETDGNNQEAPTGADLCADTDGSSQSNDICAETDGAQLDDSSKESADICSDTDGAVNSLSDALDGNLPEGETEKDVADSIDDTDMAIGTDSEGPVSRPDSFKNDDEGDMGLSEEEATEDGPDLQDVLKEDLDNHADSIQREKVVGMISSALEGFKANKQILEKAKEQAPELYNSTIAMLKAMIEMAKMLVLDQGENSDDSGENSEPQSEGYPGDEEDVNQPQPPEQLQPQKDQKGIGPGLGKLPTSKTTKHVARTPFPPGAVNSKGQKKQIDPQTGKTRWINMREGRVKSATGIPIKNPRSSSDES